MVDIIITLVRLKIQLKLKGSEPQLEKSFMSRKNFRSHTKVVVMESH